jgi:hypothetical protein
MRNEQPCLYSDFEQINFKFYYKYFQWSQTIFSAVVCARKSVHFDRCFWSKHILQKMFSRICFSFTRNVRKGGRMLDTRSFRRSKEKSENILCLVSLAFELSGCCVCGSCNQCFLLAWPIEWKLILRWETHTSDEVCSSCWHAFVLWHTLNLQYYLLCVCYCSVYNLLSYSLLSKIIIIKYTDS